MGLLKLLAFPITGPLKVAEVLRDEAERRLYDTDAIRQQMIELAEQFQAGQVDQEQFDRAEEQLLQRLIDAREYHRQRDESFDALT